MPKKLQPKKAIVVSESESEDEPKFLESTLKLIKLGEAIETQTNNKIALDLDALFAKAKFK